MPIKKEIKFNNIRYRVQIIAMSNVKAVQKMQSTDQSQNY